MESCRFQFLSLTTVLQTKEDCWLSQRCCRDQTEDAHALHWIMATGTVTAEMSTKNSRTSLCRLSFVYSHSWQRSGPKHKLHLILDFVCVCVRRRWASCSFLTTSQTAWSTSPPWWTTSGTTRETDPQTWVDPITLDCLLLLLIPSCPPFTTNPTISGLPPPRLLPLPTAASVPVYTMSIDIACFWIAGRCPFKNVYLYSLSSLQSKV